ncbi:ankyrin repeat-containing domain protein [Xylaria digitata]|nr:ankyrin repeat-containing domain protein [Xylaria digitata]
MEALGLGANVAAFVVIAAQLSTVLYTTFSSIKDGPDNVRRVAAHLLQLHGVLEQIRLSSLTSWDTALATHVGECVKDLNSLADSVQKLELTRDETRTGRMWKRFKSFLDEKKLDRICDQLVTHTSTLNLRLNLLNSNTTHELLSGAHTMNRLINGLSGSVEKQTESLTAKFDNVDNTLHTQHDRLQSGLTSIQAAVDNMSYMSQMKADFMLDLLIQMKNSIVNPTRQEKVTDNTLEQKGESNIKYVKEDENDESALNADLVQSITRLCRLIKEKNQTFDTEAEDDPQAEDIMEDLHILLDSVRKYGKAFRGDLRRFRQAFGQVQLHVNQENGRDNVPHSTSIQRKRTYTTVFLKGLGTLSLMITKQTQTSSAREDVSTMVFSFLPKDPQQFMMIVASTTHRIMPSGPVPPISRLAVNRVLPAGSRVFNVVEKGLLRELQVMIQKDEATLRDHDEYGANLLFYAVYGQKIEMCRFLLENGADVDHVANIRGMAWGRTDDPRFVLDIYSMTDYVNHFGHDPRNTCSRLLLGAGADPTAHMPGTTSFLEYCTRNGRAESFNLVWGPRSKNLFIDINDTIPGSTEPLLLACRAFNYDDIAERVRRFLDAGANVHLRNNSGQSCLHICLQNARTHLKASHDLIRSQFHAIKLLIERGADVYAVDKFGKSVSGSVYADMISGFAGGLWDSVLQSCGYGIAEFRKNYKRSASYDENYSRRGFEVLWEGREDQCPYWNDAAWPPDALWDPPVKESERETDETSNEEPGESAGSFPIERKDEGEMLMGKDWRWQEQPALESDSHAIPEFSETLAQPASTIDDGADDMGNMIREQGREVIENVEFSGLFENPWV